MEEIAREPKTCREWPQLPREKEDLWWILEKKVCAQDRFCKKEFKR